MHMQVLCAANTSWLRKLLPRPPRTPHWPPMQSLPSLRSSAPSVGLWSPSSVSSH